MRYFPAGSPHTRPNINHLLMITDTFTSTTEARGIQTLSLFFPYHGSEPIFFEKFDTIYITQIDRIGGV